MVELRKRSAPTTPAVESRTAKRPATKTSRAKIEKSDSRDDLEKGEEGSVAKNDDGGDDAGVSKAEEEEKKETKARVKTTAPLSAESVGVTIEVEGFGGTVKTHAGKDVTVRELLERSENGIVVFTYPKASTPGCTTQACLFRDSYAPLQAAGLSVYGLSTDSPKANTTFATKQKLPFDLLCDPEATLTGALGLKKGVGKGTLRGSVVIGKGGKVESWIQAGPAKTLEVVIAWIDGKK